MRTTLFKSAKSLVDAAVKMVSAFISLVIISSQTAMAQDGNAGINQATSQVKSYFDTGTNLMYAIGAIVGLVGAIKVFKKWTSEGLAMAPNRLWRKGQDSFVVQTYILLTAKRQQFNPFSIAMTSVAI